MTGGPTNGGGALSDPEASATPPEAGDAGAPLEDGDGDVPELPEAAGRRLSGGAWSSGLSVADFASCEELGMEPLGLVQGYSVMQWAWYGAYSFGPSGYAGQYSSGQYRENWPCPHGMVGADHRFYGMNLEQAWLEQAWANGWGSALRRMVDEALQLGAHGVVGVVDDVHPLAGTSTQEFSLRGTAVAVRDARRPAEPFSTYLAGQRLAKLLGAGYVPVAVVSALSSVYMYANCVTLALVTGRTGWGGVAGVQPIRQVDRAQQVARHLARQRIRQRLGGDVLHGATFTAFERESGEGNLAIQCTARGTRVRRYADFGPSPSPTPVVRLS